MDGNKQKELEHVRMQGLARFEFFEALCRIADLKYKQIGRCETVAEGLELMFEQMELSYPFIGWQEFRDYDLWTNEVNDCLHENRDAINKLIKFYILPPERQLTKDQCIKLFNDSGIKITVDDI